MQIKTREIQILHFRLVRNKFMCCRKNPIIKKKTTQLQSSHVWNDEKLSHPFRDNIDFGWTAPKKSDKNRLINIRLKSQNM